MSSTWRRQRTISGSALPSTSTVTVDTQEGEWNAQIYAAAASSGSLSGWGRPLATGTNLGQQAVLTLKPRTHARVVLLWITLLPPSGRLDVAEIQVR